jgi:hypothetical protein
MWATPSTSSADAYIPCTRPIQAFASTLMDERPNGLVPSRRPRALLKTKRKILPEIDTNEDDSRANQIKDALPTWVFKTAKQHNFFTYMPQLGLDLLKSIKQFVWGYKAELLPVGLWKRALLRGYVPPTSDLSTRRSYR